MEEAFGACLCGELIEIDYNPCISKGFDVQRTSLQASRSPVEYLTNSTNLSGCMLPPKTAKARNSSTPPPPTPLR